MKDTIPMRLESFHNGDMSISMPFDLNINGTPYCCSEVLRLLPGKRLVVKAENNGQFYVIKLFSNAQKGQRELKREQRGFERVNSAGVNTPELAFYNDNTAGCSLIAYAYLDSARAFKRDQKDIVQYKEPLVKLVTTLHNAGIYQDDFHLDNLLIAQGKLFLIDLSSVKVEHEQGSVSREVSLKNLAKLIVQFKPKQQKHLVKQLKKYYEQRNWLWSENENKRCQDYIDKAWGKRKTNYLKKCFRSCTMTHYKQSFSQQTAFRRSFINNVGQDFISNIEQLVQGGELLKDGNSATVVKVNYAGRVLVIKRYNIKSIWHFLKRCYRPSRAAISWGNGNLLELLGIPTPKALGFIENRFGLFRKNAYLICEYIDGEELQEVYDKREPIGLELEQLENIFKILRKYRISHGDLKASNLLLENKIISLIDLDAMQEHKNDSSLLKALGKDKKRFMKNWNNQGLQSKLDKLF